MPTLDVDDNLIEGWLHSVSPNGEFSFRMYCSKTKNSKFMHSYISFIWHIFSMEHINQGWSCN